MVSQLTQSPLQIANPEQLERIRHTCAHIMAMAVQILFPETKVTIGPTTDTGFYYDFDRSQPFTPEDLKKITKQMRFIKCLSKINCIFFTKVYPSFKLNQL